MLQQLFNDFGCTAQDTGIYLYLLENGNKQASAVARQFNMPRATMYGHLDRLAQAGFINSFERNTIKEFAAATPDKLNLLYRQKLDRMQNAQKQFETAIPELQALTGSRNAAPRLHYFAGRQGVQNMMSDILLRRDITIYSFWPVQSMIDLMEADYLTYFNLERIRRNITLRAIWPASQTIDVRKHQFMGVGKEFLREARIGPVNLDARLSYLIYDDRVMFISSRQEEFGFVLQSKDMADTLIDQFNVIWNLSTPVAHPVSHAKAFLDELKKAIKS